MNCRKIRRAAIATQNQGKFYAAKRVIARLCGISNIISVNYSKELPPQPIGSLEVTKGALLRAISAYKTLNSEGFGIGLEAGPLEFYTGNGYLEGEIAVIIGPPEGRVSIGISSLFPLPSWIIEKMKLGYELRRLLQASPRNVDQLAESIGYIGITSKGLITRTDLHIQAIASALLPWVNGFEIELPVINDYSWMLESNSV